MVGNWNQSETKIRPQIPGTVAPRPCETPQAATCKTWRPPQCPYTSEFTRMTDLYVCVKATLVGKIRCARRLRMTHARSANLSKQGSNVASNLQRSRVLPNEWTVRRTAARRAAKYLPPLNRVAGR